MFANQAWLVRPHDRRARRRSRPPHGIPHARPPGRPDFTESWYFRAQTVHWQRLFTDALDAGYYASVRAIGLMHHKIGLEPRWYLGGYNYVLTRLHHLAVGACRWSPGKLRGVPGAGRACTEGEGNRVGT